MRKLKLQVQMSVDGFVGGPNGEMDWMTWTWDERLKEYVNTLTDLVDTILLGRKMTDGFVNHWENVKPDTEEYAFARKMVERPKIVFSKTLTESSWPNTTIATGEVEEEVAKLKQLAGKDIIVYGGAGFNASLIQARLIDELYLFVNPSAIGSGISIFKNLTAKQDFTLIESIAFDCGIVLLHYKIKTQ